MKIIRKNMAKLVEETWQKCMVPEKIGQNCITTNETALINIILLTPIDESDLYYQFGCINDRLHRQLVESGWTSNDIYAQYRKEHVINITKLEQQRKLIVSILDNLSDKCKEKQIYDEFMIDKYNEQWTFSIDIVYQLLAMAIALGLVNWYSENPEVLQKSCYHDHKNIVFPMKYNKLYFKIENENKIEVNLSNKSELIDRIYWYCSFQFWDIPETIIPVLHENKFEYFEYFRLQNKQSLIEKILDFERTLNRKNFIFNHSIANIDPKAENSFQNSKLAYLFKALINANLIYEPNLDFKRVVCRPVLPPLYPKSYYASPDCAFVP